MVVSNWKKSACRKPLGRTGGSRNTSRRGRGAPTHADDQIGGPSGSAIGASLVYACSAISARRLDV